MTLKFWINFVYIGIILFITSVISTFIYFATTNRLFSSIGIVTSVIGVFMIYFGIWKGDKVK